MLKTLYGKLTTVLVGLLFLIGVSYILLTLFTTRMHLQEVTQKLNLSLAENLASEMILMKGQKVDENALKEVLHMLMVVNPNIEIYILDLNGAILAFSAPPGKVKRQNVSLEPIQRFLSRIHKLPILGDDPRDLNRKKVFSVSPLPVKGPAEGYLYIVLASEEYDSVAEMLQRSYILQLSIWAIVGGLLFAGVSGFLLFNLLTRRLRKLAAVMESFKQGDFLEYPDSSRIVNNYQGDEIDWLGTTFNEMSDRISQQMKKLKETDTLRRELVANVSHDLRTPLASLQGYLETLLLKEGKLKPEEQRDYLKIALKHGTRLGKLVSELFELAKLDSQEIQLHAEPFSLGELAQDVLQKFQLNAEQKKIDLQLSFRRDLPFVLADIALIERVLENLVENALRYTPEGGIITASLIPPRNNEKITVRITDTGCGIPQEDLPYIFDRFYRVEKNRQEKSGGSGLGLAISKRILELHGSSIEVDSRVQVGTTFTFYLPISKMGL
jgi:signal transduction histidine kinase